MIYYAASDAIAAFLISLHDTRHLPPAAATSHCAKDFVCLRFVCLPMPPFLPVVGTYAATSSYHYHAPRRSVYERDGLFSHTIAEAP